MVADVRLSFAGVSLYYWCDVTTVRQRPYELDGMGFRATWDWVRWILFRIHPRDGVCVVALGS